MPIEVAQALRATRTSAVRAALAPLPLADRPLTLEIGCGHGHFLTAYAAAHPDEYCVAIDLLAERLVRAGRKSDRAGITNLAWVHAEAADLLAAWPDERLISRRVFILFPDPWPKRRHWKNRLIQPAFLGDLARICAVGTDLCFRTDHAPYFVEALTHVQEHPAWEMQPPGAWPFETITVFQARAPAYQSLVARRRPDPD